MRSVAPVLYACKIRYAIHFKYLQLWQIVLIICWVGGDYDWTFDLLISLGQSAWHKQKVSPKGNKTNGGFSRWERGREYVNERHSTFGCNKTVLLLEPCWKYFVHLQEGWTINVNSILRQPPLFEDIFLHPFLTLNMILQNERIWAFVFYFYWWCLRTKFCF